MIHEPVTVATEHSKVRIPVLMESNKTRMDN